MENNKIAQEFFSLKKELQSFAIYLARDKHTAEDLFQDTAMRVFRNGDKYHENTNFKAWVMVIMRNTFINYYRKKKRTKEVYDNSDDSYIMNSLSNSVQNQGENNFLMKELMGMIESLEEGLKKPFVMSYEGYKYEEIANEMQLPLGTVKSRIFQARKQLKKQISIQYNEENYRLTAA